MQLLNTQIAFKTQKRNDFTMQLKPVLRYISDQYRDIIELISPAM